jgi:hypothetical protein
MSNIDEALLNLLNRLEFILEISRLERIGDTVTDLSKIQKELRERQLPVTNMIIPAKLWNELIDSIPNGLWGSYPVDGEYHNRLLGIKVIANTFIEKHIILYNVDQVVGIIDLEE